MKAKMNTVWGLNSDAARLLYARIAADAPRADATHCANIGARWLALDAVRGAMRAAGVAEEFISGNASDFEKLEALLAVMPHLAGHRVAGWCAYDLAYTFGCSLSLTAENAAAIWQETASDMAELPWENTRIFSPVSALVWLERGIKDATEALSAQSGIAVCNLDTLCDAYRVLLDDFAKKGGNMLSLALDPAFSFVSPNPYHANEHFVRALQRDGKGVKDGERALFFAQLVRFFAEEAERRGLTLCLLPERGVPCGEVRIGLPCRELGGLAALLQYLHSFSLVPPTLLVAQSADDLIAVAPLCEAFAATEKGARLRPALRISPCFDPDAMCRELASVSRYLPIGSLVPMTDGDATLADAVLRVLCSLLCDKAGAEDVIREILSQMK